jgi:hypothetical protein
MSGSRIVQLAMFAMVVFGSVETAFANIMSYDFTAAGFWFHLGTPPFGLSSDPTITGSLTVDNTLIGPASFDAISVTTGTMIWDQTMLNPAIIGNNGTDFDAAGNLTCFLFSLGNLGGTGQNGAFLIVSSNNTSNLDDGLGNSIACNYCVSFQAVPEPRTLPVLAGCLIGLFAMACRRKRA